MNPKAPSRITLRQTATGLALLLAGGLMGASRLLGGPVLETLVQFYNGPGNPTGALVQGPDGNFYGTAPEGGSYNCGLVFKMTPGGVITPLVTFTGTTGNRRGANPYAGLVLGRDGNFYGMTKAGGSMFNGTIFKMAPDGTLTTLIDFAGDTGPHRGAGGRYALIEGRDGNLYGTTPFGGVNEAGTAFSVTPAGVLTTLVDFAGSNGYRPNASLVEGDDGNFYGTTESGGSGGAGTVFRLTPAGVITVLKNFVSDFAGPSGRWPEAALVKGNDGNLYGTTSSGGSSGYGTIFRISLAGDFTTLAELTGASGAHPGSYPYSLVKSNDGNFYGTTQYGVSSNGTIFKMTPTGVITVLATFDDTLGPNPGSQPEAPLVQGADGNFYGATSSGGSGGRGTFFKVTPTGSLTTLNELTVDGTSVGLVGSQPVANLVQASNGNFYGSTRFGGTKGLGTIFKMTPDGAFTSLAAFSGNQGVADRGAYPLGALVEHPNGNLYGASSSGGAVGAGTVFKITPAGAMSLVADLYGTTGPQLGADSEAALVRHPNGSLYGTTQTGGASNQGTIFTIAPNGSFSTIVEFTGNGVTNRGALPKAALLLANDGNFYGTTAGGGSANAGTVFRMTPAGVVTTLVDFPGQFAFDSAAAPTGALVQGSDNNFYGTVSVGGSSFQYGSIFKMTPAGVLTKLVDFTGTGGANRGAKPSGALVLGSDGNFYGTTVAGGNSDSGTIFKMTPAGVMTTVVEFTQSGDFNAGAQPGTALVLGNDGNFYGVAGGGGAGGNGTVFRLRVGSTPATLPATAITPTQATLNGMVNPNGAQSAVIFEYGTAPNQLISSTASQILAAGNGAIPVSANLAGLAPATTYYFRIRGDNAEQFQPQRGAVLSFTTLAGSAPSFSSPASTIFTEGTSGSFQFTALGAPAPSFSAAGSLPANVTLGIDGLLSGTPAVGTGGSYPLTITAANEIAPDATQAFTLVINRPPVARPDAVTTQRDTAISLPAANLMANDTDADDDAITLEGVIANSAQGGAVTLSAGTLTYAPPLGFVGTDAFSYNIADGRGGFASGLVNVTVTESTSAPPRFVGVTMETSGRRVQWQDVVGRTFIIQYSDELGVWQPFVGTVTADATGAVEYFDTTTPVPPQRFYRTLLP